MPFPNANITNVSRDHSPRVTGTVPAASNFDNAKKRISGEIATEAPASFCPSFCARNGFDKRFR